jgi:hypothetical protein
MHAPAAAAAARQRGRASNRGGDGRQDLGNVAIALDDDAGIQYGSSSFGGDRSGEVHKTRRRRLEERGGDNGGELKPESHLLSPEEIQEMLLRPSEEEEAKATTIGVILGLIMLFMLISFAYSYLMIFKIIFK